jgi:hypothetical protein
MITNLKAVLAVAAITATAALAAIGTADAATTTPAAAGRPAAQDIYYAAPKTDDIYYAAGCSSCYGLGSVNAKTTTAIGVWNNAPISNYSSTRWGAIGIVSTGSTALGYDYLLYSGQNGRGSGFWVGTTSARVKVMTKDGNGWRQVRGPYAGGLFGYGRHLFGDSNLYTLERVA